MTREARFLSGMCAALALAVFGCGPTLEGGLANAPSARRSSQPRGQHDVISNGPNSCGGGEPGEKYRVPPCANADDSDAGTAAAPPNQERKESQ
jgi:hypothetical protein